MDATKLHAMIDAKNTGSEFLHGLVDAIASVDRKIAKIVEDFSPPALEAEEKDDQ